MTMSGDFGVSGSGQDLNANYPVVFGITMTPTVIGALAAVLGLAGAVYLFLNLVQPAWNEFQTLQADVSTKQGQVNQEQANLKKIEDAKARLERAKQRQTEVLTLFSDERSLDTLLLDLNREFNKPGRKATLFNFTPTGPAGLITDSSLGPAANNKLKSQQVSVSMEGNFAQTQALIRSLERLQPLILFRGFNTQRDSSKQKLVVDRSGRTVLTGEANLRTNFTLQVVVTPIGGPPPAAPPPK